MAVFPAIESYSERLSYRPHTCFFSVLINLIVIYVCYSCETKHSAFILSHVADVFPAFMYGLHILILRFENMALFIINILSSLFCFVT